MAHQPSIVIVQGAYQTADFYHEFEQCLRQHGLEVYHPILPTCSDPENPKFATRTIRHDAGVVAEQVQQLLNDGRQVAIFMHSYGGLVGAEAIEESKSLKSRQLAGLKGGVSSLVYCSAFALQEGASVTGTFGKSQGDDFHVRVLSTFLSIASQEQADGRNTIRDAEVRLFNDLDAEQIGKWTSKIIPHSSKTHEYAMTNSAWKYIPATYIILDKDMCVPMQAQEMIAGMIGASVQHFQAGHEAILSRPGKLSEQVASLVLAAVGKNLQTQQ